MISRLDREDYHPQRQELLWVDQEAYCDPWKLEPARHRAPYVRTLPRTVYAAGPTGRTVTALLSVSLRAVSGDDGTARFRPITCGRRFPLNTRIYSVSEQAEWELDKIFGSYDNDDGWRWWNDEPAPPKPAPGVARPKLKPADPEDFPVV